MAVPPDRGEVHVGDTVLDAGTEFSRRPALVTQDFRPGWRFSPPPRPSVCHCNHCCSRRTRSESEPLTGSRNWVWSRAPSGPVSDLSGGQRQRVAIARALAKGADVVVMDEPTAELDPVNRGLLLRLLDVECARGVAVVVVFHESDLVERADTVFEVTKL